MTATDAKNFARATGAILLAIAAPIIVAVLVGAWTSKESTADHNADIARIESNVQRILDVVCDGQRATQRACK